MRKLTSIGFWAMVVFSLIIALSSYRFFLLGMEPAFEGLGASVLDPRLPFIMHVVAAPLALATGSLQFFSNIRQKRPVLHRWNGRIYGLAVLFGGIAGLIMAVDATDRPMAAAGFGILAVIWLWFTASGVLHARAKRFDAHQAMMLRSFALAFGAVTLRLQLPFLMADGSSYLDVSHIVSWTAWVPNLIVVELWLRRRQLGLAGQNIRDGAKSIA